MRLKPESGSAVLATLKQGEVVRNLGCRMTSETRWCKILSTTGIDVTGWVTGRYLRETAAPPPVFPADDGGPDFYVVAGLVAGDTLNIRSTASTQSNIIARLNKGAKVRNLGCRQSGQTRWCKIRSTGGVDVTGWVNGRYLREF